MPDDTARSHVINRRQLRRGSRASLAVAEVATVGLLAAACAGGSPGPGVASLRGTTTTVASSGSFGRGSSGESSQSEQLQFAHCMRSHGVTDFPDPSPTGGQLQDIAHSGVNPRSPTYRAALRACEKYTPAGNMTPAQTAADNAKGVLFSQCMRSHGVPNFPDPVIGPTGGQAINLGPEHIDPNSSIVEAANRACQKIIPLGK